MILVTHTALKSIFYFHISIGTIEDINCLMLIMIFFQTYVLVYFLNYNVTLRYSHENCHI